MSCCGNKRAAASGALRRRDPSARGRLAASSRAVPLTPARAPDRPVRYVGVRAVRVRGAASGRTYTASATDQLLMIDARDAAALMRTGLFRTAASAP